MSKTERALDVDAAALDELDDFVTAEAEAADRAIGELIDDAVAPPNGNGNGHVDEYDLEPDDSDVVDVVDVVDMAQLEVDEPDVVDVADEIDEIEAGEADIDDAAVELDIADELDVAGESEVGEPDMADDIDVADASAPDVVAGVDDAEVGGSFELPVIVPATEPDEDVDDGGAVAPFVVGAAGVAAATVAAPSAREGELDEVSDDILEELRRADIDGPIVDFAPQDDTTSARRRPKRRPDYDPAPIPIPAKPPRLLGRKPRVRKVTRVVRNVDPWSVFKIAAVAFMVLYVVMLTSGVLLWNVAYATGTVDNVERFFESFGWSTFEFNGGEIYHASWIMGLFVVVGLTGMAVLTATLFNLITDIVGGVRFTVLEEEVVETRTSAMRRFVVRRPEPEVPAKIEDSSGAMIREAVVDDSGAIER